MTIYELHWKFRCDKQNLNNLADEIADKMTDEDFYWSKIDEILNSPESAQHLESLGIDQAGKFRSDIAEEIAKHHFHQLTEPINEYLEKVYSDFERFMKDIFSNEVITYSLNEFEVASVDYGGDKSSVTLDFGEDVGESQVKQLMQKAFEENCADYESYTDDLYYEIECPIIRYIPFRLNSQEAYNKILRYLTIIPEVKEVKE